MDKPPDTDLRLRTDLMNNDVRLWTNEQDHRLPVGATICENRCGGYDAEMADGQIVLGCGSYERALVVAGETPRPAPDHLRLIKFNFYCRSMGTLTGMFVLDDAGWARWLALVAAKTTVHFGEVLGKHSDIAGPIESGDFEVVSEDQGFCAAWKSIGCDNGHNPLDYIDEGSS